MFSEKSLKSRNRRLIGQELSPLESVVYRTIRKAEANIISTKEIIEEVSKNYEQGSTESSIKAVVCHLRNKIGQEEILNIFGWGYISRTEVIKEMVRLNLECPFDENFTFEDVMRGIIVEIKTRKGEEK